MPDTLTDLLHLFTRTVNPSRRSQAARDLAQYLDADDLIIFIADPETGTLVPAPGFAQTLPGRRTWRRFLEECRNAGVCHADLPYPSSRHSTRALGVLGEDGSILVALGGAPDREKADEACLYLPLLAAVLREEQAARVAAGREQAMRETTSQLSTLAKALDATRVELQGALQAAATANEKMEHELAERRRVEGRLQELNETLEQRVTRRTAELERANNALRRSNRDLQDFAYVASHDLQEPLRKVTMFANLLQLDYADRLDEEGLEVLRRIQNAGVRMSQLLSDLLSFSRVKTHARAFEPVDLKEVVQNVLSDLEMRLEETEGHVEIGVLPKIEADPSQMHQLLLNLVSNALKFHRPGVPPVVRVESRMEEDGVAGPGNCHITVSDNGIGFDEKYLDRIFAPFQRLHGRSSAYPGTGMGLAICQRIVEHHGGTITAHSEPGQGTTFTVALSCRRSE